VSEKKSLKQEAKGEGAPIWIISFADMMSLLMSFMVAMLSMSELRSGQKLKEVVHSFQNALGYQGGGWLMSAEVPPNGLSFEEQVRQLSQALMARRLQMQQGNSQDKGIEGENATVKTVREGLQFTVGGAVSFEAGKAKLMERAQKQLATFAELIRGLNNKIRVRGHAARVPLEQIAPFTSLDGLSYARAVAVKEYLIQEGIRAERITVEACGDTEPLNVQAYDETSRAQNRRVDVIMIEALVEDFQGQPSSKRKDLIDG
jgi:chemotaxis protein MotB